MAYNISFTRFARLTDEAHFARVAAAENARQGAVSAAQAAAATLVLSDSTPSAYPSLAKAIQQAEAVKAATIAASETQRQQDRGRVAAALAHLGSGSFADLASVQAAIAGVGFTGLADAADASSGQLASIQ